MSDAAQTIEAPQTAPATDAAQFLAQPAPAPAADPAAPSASTLTPSSFDLSSIDDAELRGWAQNKAFPDLKAALESQRNLEKLLGADKLPLPRDDNDSEGWERVAKALGRPDTPDGYGLKDAPGADADFVGQAGRWFHAAGLNRRQAESLAGAYAEFGAQVQAREAAEFSANAAAELSAIQGEWGPLADQRGEEARRGLRLLGWDVDTAGKFERALGTRAMLTALSRIGGAIGEDNLVTGDAPRGFGLTPAAARARIRSLSADKAWSARYIAGDTEAKAEMERLNRAVAEG